MMRRNRKHQVQSRIISVPIVGVFVLVVFVAVGYLAVDNRCNARGQLIRDLENRYASLEDERLREEAKWNAMKTPDELERRLLQHGINMVYARPEQIVRMAALDTSSIAGTGHYQERERSAGLARPGL